MPSAAHQRVKSQIQVTTRKVGQTRHKPKTARERSPLCGQFSSPRSGTHFPKLMPEFYFSAILGVGQRFQNNKNKKNRDKPPEIED